MGSPAKLERQLNLMATLLDTRRPLTRTQVRERVSGYPADAVAYRRAFERDKDELRRMGIPVVVEMIPGSTPPEDGYRIPRDEHYLRDPDLTPEELAALHFAASAVRIEGAAPDAALQKLGGRPDPSTDAPGEFGAIPFDANVVPLFQAVSERRVATFVYNREERTVDAHRLDFQRAHWYLSGHDHLRGEARVFRLDRIDGDVQLSPAGAFARPPRGTAGARLQPWELGNGDGMVAKVAIDADQASSALQYAGDAARASRRRDGRTVLELRVTNVAGFRSFVLGYLEHAEILQPKALRQDIIDWLEAMAER